MRTRHGWLIALVAVALLVAACGPEMVTPTPGDKVSGTVSTEVATTALPAKTPVDTAPTATQEKEPTPEPVSAGDLPVDEEDWHILGSPDAPVTIVEYSDFQ